MDQPIRLKTVKPRIRMRYYGDASSPTYTVFQAGMILVVGGDLWSVYETVVTLCCSGDQV